jgi:chemotaxis protein methyltransferase CheR
VSPGESEKIAAIVSALHGQTGVDFSRYRPATVHRRIRNRMISVGTDCLDAYLSLLARSAEEAGHLLSRISIKVSRFYRNAHSYEFLRNDVLPELARKAGAGGVRIWSAGCGFGEEPYTLAMLLEEAGIAGTVVATDIDPAAIAAAVRGVYPAQAVNELPEGLARRYLVPAEGGSNLVEVPGCVRARVRFHALDLLQGDVPGGGRFDLICCRNVLIYYQSDVQRELFGFFGGALRPGGVLFLGEAEWPPVPHAASLECIARSARIFRALPGFQA